MARDCCDGTEEAEDELEITLSEDEGDEDKRACASEDEEEEDEEDEEESWSDSSVSFEEAMAFVFKVFSGLFWLLSLGEGGVRLRGRGGVSGPEALRA